MHSQSRPHYCPVAGCSRSEGGKGFKRKNEMIRHGLVHNSPGYVCPFCPDREHRYPRPDNLQRYVADPAMRTVEISKCGLVADFVTDMSAFTTWIKIATTTSCATFSTSVLRARARHADVVPIRDSWWLRSDHAMPLSSI